MPNVAKQGDMLPSDKLSPAMEQAMQAYADSRGKFVSVEDIKRVPLMVCSVSQVKHVMTKFAKFGGETPVVHLVLQDMAGREVLLSIFGPEDGSDSVGSQAYRLFSNPALSEAVNDGARPIAIFEKKDIGKGMTMTEATLYATWPL